MQTYESSNRYRNYVLIMLTLVYVFNFIDRQLIVILQESIKKELNLSDTQLGLLSGFTFAIFYVTLGIPIARIADKTNRKNTVAISLALWSAMTALSGLARNFVQLLLARIGVGVGEAGGSPPAHALISDYFPPEKRLNQHLGWRTAFFVVGVPGIIFSILFYASVKEPKRGATDLNAGSPADQSLGNVLRRLYSTNTFVYLALATGLHVFCIYGLINWAPSFLMRLHGMKSSDLGALLGPIFGIGGAIGSFAGGFLTDYFGKKDKSWYLKIPAYSIILSIFFAAGALFLRDTTSSIICLGCCAALQSMYLGPSIAVAHSLVPASMRSLTSAVLFFVLNLIGLGLGPLVVGMISDQLAPSLGMESLRWALSIIIVVGALSTILFFISARKLVVDLARNS